MSLAITEELIARQSPEAQTIIRLLLAHIAELEAEVRRLRKTPENSSVPPSTQHPHAKPPKKKTRSKRKRGGQPGHQKCERPLVPAADREEHVSLKPDACRRCGTPLDGGDVEPLRQQVRDSSEIRPPITGYRRLWLSCSCCDESTCTPLSAGGLHRAADGVLPAETSPHALFLETVFGPPCSTGLTVKQQTPATQPVRPASRQFAATRPEQSHVTANETPTKEASVKSCCGPS